MLTVAKVTTNLAAGYADYLEGKTTATSLGDYYLKDGERVEAAGRWVTGTDRVGIDAAAPVNGQVLRELMAVRHPTTGDQLRRVGASGEAVAALDATFSAPKSVSAVWALANPELRAQIETAHERAIDRAITYAIRQVAMVRERLDRDTVIHTQAVDVVATGWRHTTARSVNGQAPDPQLHTHVLLHAAVRSDGRLVAIDSRAWLLHRRELGAAYRTELARGLTELGFGIERGTGRGGRYFEIHGVPQELLDRWSSRHQQIQEAIRQRVARVGGRALTPGEERMAAVLTRASKQPVTIGDLDRAWQQTADRAGFTTDDGRRLRDPERSSPEPIDRLRLLAGLTEFDATFTDRQARAVALEASAGVTIDQALSTLRQTDANGMLLTLTDGSRTTGWHRGRERATVTTFTALTENRVEPIPAHLVKQSAQIINRRLATTGGGLSVEQGQALAVATGDRQVVMIEGQAGTGKSTVLQAVALSHQADSRQVIVTSTAAVAAERLAGDLAQAGVSAPAFSTVALEQATRSGRVELGPATTVIHDEAALASTREQHHLFQTVEDSGARLIIVGDPRQSQPVGAGGLWPQLERTASADHARVELTQNLRARDPADRRDQALFRQGEHQQALEGYGARGRVQIAAGQTDAEHQALVTAHHDRRNGLQTIVIAQTSNEHLDELNAHAQALRRKDRELGHNSVPVPSRPYRLYAGDLVQIRHTLHHPDWDLRNGTTATIAQVKQDTAVTLTLADGSRRVLDRRQIEQADLRLAYVQHPFPAQGITSDTAHLLVAEHATREGTYVAITRPRQAAYIHVGREALEADPERDPLAQLAELLGRSEPEIPSIAIPLAPELLPAREQQPTRELERDDGLGWEL